MTGSNAISRRAALGGLAGTAAMAAAGDAFATTTRTLAVPSFGGPSFGLKSYAQSLPLADGEVILTFDDGPLPGPTDRVLAALHAADMRATFFVIGRNARAYPQLLRRTAALGHTIANHTENHLWTLRQRSYEVGVREIEQGEDTIQQALGGRIAPFFRFPGFADTAPLLAELSRRNRTVWGADLWASDWNAMPAARQLALVTARLRRARKGIILFHDVRPQTADMLPAFLAWLPANGFRVVHAVPG